MNKIYNYVFFIFGLVFFLICSSQASPSIVGTWTNYTGYNVTVMLVENGTLPTIQFNATSDSIINNWEWSYNGSVVQNTSSNTVNISITSKSGIDYVTVRAINTTNGSSTNKTFYINIKEPCVTAFCKISHIGNGGVFDSFTSADGNYLYVAQGTEVRVYNVTNKSLIVDLSYESYIKKIDTGDYLIRAMTIDGNYLYAATYEPAIILIDISTPSNPVNYSKYTNTTLPGVSAGYYDVEVSGNYIFATQYERGLAVFNQTDKEHISFVTVLPLPGPPLAGGNYNRPWKINISNSKAYITSETDNRLIVVDISTPTAPVKLGEWTAGLLCCSNYTSGVQANGNYAYVVAYQHGIYSLNVSNPANITIADSIVDWNTNDFYASDAKIVDNWLYVSTRYEGYRIIDISDPTNLVYVNSSIVGLSTGYTEGITIVGNWTYLSKNTMGLEIFNASNQTAPFSETRIFVPEPNAVTVKDHYMYIGSWNDGVWSYNISNMSNPVFVAFSTFSARMYHMKAIGNYIYTSGAWGGMNILNVTYPEAPVWDATNWGTYAGWDYNSAQFDVDNNQQVFATDTDGGSIISANFTNHSGAVLDNLLDIHEPSDVGVQIFNESNVIVVGTQNWKGLTVINKSVPTSLIEVSRFLNNTPFYDVRIRGTDIFVVGCNVPGCTTPATIWSFNGTNLSGITNLSHLTYSGLIASKMDLSYNKNVLYATDNMIKSVNVTNASTMTAIGTYTLPVRVGDIETIGNNVQMISALSSGAYLFQSNISAVFEATPEEPASSNILARDLYYNPTPSRLGVEINATAYNFHTLYAGKDLAIKITVQANQTINKVRTKWYGRYGNITSDVNITMHEGTVDGAIIAEAVITNETMAQATISADLNTSVGVVNGTAYWFTFNTSEGDATDFYYLFSTDGSSELFDVNENSGSGWTDTKSTPYIVLSNGTWYQGNFYYTTLSSATSYISGNKYEGEIFTVESPITVNSVNVWMSVNPGETSNVRAVVVNSLGVELANATNTTPITTTPSYINFSFGGNVTLTSQNKLYFTMRSNTTQYGAIVYFLIPDETGESTWGGITNRRIYVENGNTSAWNYTDSYDLEYYFDYNPALSPIVTPTTTITISSYVESTCASTINWGVVGSSLVVILVIIVAGTLAVGFLSGKGVNDTIPLKQFVLTLVGIVVVGSIGIAIINPIITAIGCP